MSILDSLADAVGRMVAGALAALRDEEHGECTMFEHREGIPAVRGLEVTTEEFRTRLCELARELEIPVGWLAAIISFETSGTFNPTVTNKASGAVGLIQWLPSAAEYCGTTQAALRRMTATGQLAYVGRYFKHFAGKMCTLEQAYCLVLGGKLVDGPLQVLFAEGTTAYQQNRALDPGGVGYITAEMATRPVRRILDNGYKTGRWL